MLLPTIRQGVRNFQQQTANSSDLIKLGLERIAKLFSPQDVNFNAVHVAGTNGKGSVCFHTANMLRGRGLMVGRFTSPHLIDRWDCIHIDGKPIGEGMFLNIEQFYRKKNERLAIGASSFEILTATAFDLFRMHKVDAAVIEVGVGGRDDATNILPQHRVLCAVITEISFDHQSLLGNTIREIAQHKAGIIKPGVPCVFDSKALPAVRKVIHQTAINPTPTPADWMPAYQMNNRSLAALKNPQQPDAYSSLFPVGSEGNIRSDIVSEPPIGPFGDHHTPSFHLSTLAMAATAAQVSLLRLRKGKVARELLFRDAVGRQWPGRLQSLSVDALVQRKNPILLDGAHNFGSAMRLGSFVTHLLRLDSGDMRKGREPVTWIVAVSEGKVIKDILKAILRPGDTLIATEFGNVDGMPWVTPADACEVLDQGMRTEPGLSTSSGTASSIQPALEKATKIAGEGPVIVAGSLYLAADLLRLIRDTGGEPEDWWEKWEAPVKMDKSLWNHETGTHNIKRRQKRSDEDDSLTKFTVK